MSPPTTARTRTGGAGRNTTAEEKFTALCLPGMLPGFYMSYNHHGFAYCVNAISTTAGIVRGRADTTTRKCHSGYTCLSQSF